MYLDYWGLHRNPFDNVPDPGMYFSRHSTVESTVAELLFAIDEGNQCLAAIVGEVGMGKTMSLRMVLNELDKEKYRTVFLTNPDITFVQLVREIVSQLTGETCVLRTKEELLEEFNRLLFESADSSKKVLIFIDEANAMNSASLEGLRLLTNMQEDSRNLLTIVIAGQPKLGKMLEDPRRANLFQRIGVYARLEPMDSPETVREYVEHRLGLAGANRTVFDESAIDALYSHSGGIPRVLNRLCKLALKVGETNSLGAIDSEVISLIASRFEPDHRDQQSGGDSEVGPDGLPTNGNSGSNYLAALPPERQPNEDPDDFDLEIGQNLPHIPPGAPVQSDPVGFQFLEVGPENPPDREEAEPESPVDLIETATDDPPDREEAEHESPLTPEGTEEEGLADVEEAQADSPMDLIEAGPESSPEPVEIEPERLLNLIETEPEFAPESGETGSEGPLDLVETESEFPPEPERAESEGLVDPVETGYEFPSDREETQADSLSNLEETVFESTPDLEQTRTDSFADLIETGPEFSAELQESEPEGFLDLVEAGPKGSPDPEEMAAESFVDLIETGLESPPSDLAEIETDSSADQGDMETEVAPELIEMVGPPPPPDDPVVAESNDIDFLPADLPELESAGWSDGTSIPSQIIDALRELQDEEQRIRLAGRLAARQIQQHPELYSEAAVDPVKVWDELRNEILKKVS